MPFGHTTGEQGGRKELADPLLHTRNHMPQVLSLPDVYLEAQTTEPHTALLYLLSQYNHLVSEFTHLYTHSHTGNDLNLDRSETLGLGFDALAPPTSLTGRIRNLRRRSFKNLRGDSNKSSVTHAAPQVHEISAENSSGSLELTSPSSPKRDQGTHNLLQVTSPSPRIWNKSSSSALYAHGRMPESPSQRGSSALPSRQSAATSPKMPSRSPTISSSRTLGRRSNSRPATPVGRLLEDSFQHLITEYCPFSLVDIQVCGSMVRGLQGPDAVAVRIRLQPPASVSEASVRRRQKSIRVEKRRSDLVALRELIAARINSQPGLSNISLCPVPDQNFFEPPYNPLHLAERNAAVTAFLHSLQRLPSLFEDIMSHFFATDLVPDSEVDSHYGSCFQQDGLLLGTGEGWTFVHCALFANLFIMQDPYKQQAPLLFDLRKTRIGRQFETTASGREANSRTAMIILQKMQSSPNVQQPQIKLATESFYQHTTWMAALLREGEDNHSDRSPSEGMLDKDVNSSAVLALAVLTKESDEMQHLNSSLRTDRTVLVPESSSVTELSRQGSATKNRLWHGNDQSSTFVPTDKRRFLFGILPLNTPDELSTSPSTSHKAVFGAPLSDVVRDTGMFVDGIAGPVPALLKRSFDFLEQSSIISDEGLYRVNGSLSTIKVLQERFSTFGDVHLVAEYQEAKRTGNGSLLDSHAVAGLVKMFLRDLPEPLCTDVLMPDFVAAIEQENHEDKLQTFRRLLAYLPAENYSVLALLFLHLNHVATMSHMNKMSLQNLNIVFSATLRMPTELVWTFLHDYYLLFHQQKLFLGEHREPTMNFSASPKNDTTAKVSSLHGRMKSLSLRSPNDRKSGHFQRTSDAPLFDSKLSSFANPDAFPVPKQPEPSILAGKDHSS